MSRCLFWVYITILGPRTEVKEFGAKDEEKLHTLFTQPSDTLGILSKKHVIFGRQLVFQTMIFYGLAVKCVSCCFNSRVSHVEAYNFKVCPKNSSIPS